MKFSLKKDTLAFQLNRPGLLLINMSQASCVEIGKQVAKMRSSSLDSYMDSPVPLGPAKGSPEFDALCFYMMNHAVATVAQRVDPLEPLGKFYPVLEAYHGVLATRSIRMFFYLLLICTRESRHRKDSDSGSLMTDMWTKYGKEVCEFNNGIKGTGSEGAANAFCTKPPKASLGNYTNFLTDIFNKGTYSGGYGGKAWGKVASVLRDFSIGKISAEMMMDTAFTLCHNNGPIFNKGMLFDSFGPEIYKILDVQRAGMIPQYVASMKMGASPSFVELSGYYAICREALGTDFEGYVDWFKVEKLGALKTYTEEKKDQVLLYGKPDGSSVPEISTTKVKASVEGTIGDSKLASNSQSHKFVVVHPGCQIKIVERGAE